MSQTRVSCSEYSFPAIPGQHERIGMVRLLGFELVDLALFLAGRRPTSSPIRLRSR